MSQTAAQAIKAVLDDPSWFPVEFDLKTNITFAKTDRATLAQLPGIADSQWSYADLPQRVYPLTAVLPLIDSWPPPRVNFIWHTSYCGSTLLSRLLERTGRNLSIREPKVLVALANAKRWGHLGDPQSARAIDALFRLVGRPFPPDRAVTIKPATAVNTLVRDAAAYTEGRMLFLFSDCRSFLIDVALGGEYRRGFQRQIFTLIARDGHEQGRWNGAKLFELSDLHIAALVWHMQVAEIQRQLPTLAPGRATSLDCDAFLASPVETIAKLDRFFELDLGTSHLDEISRNGLLSRHAKRPDQPFSRVDRRERHRAISSELSHDVDGLVAWSYDACRTTTRGVPLPNPLVEIDKPYHS